jgi:hypothetical protein
MDNDAAKGFQRPGVLNSSKRNQRRKLNDGGGYEAVKVDEAARALAGMSNETSSVSSIGLCTVNFDSCTNDTETNPPFYGYKRQRQVPTNQPELVDDIPANPCMDFLPIDTDLRKPVRSPTVVESMKDHSTRFHPDEPLWNSLLNPHSECYNIQKIINMNCNAEAATVLIDQSLAIAAQSLDIPDHKEWASSWSRVQALTLARIGSAHCYATNITLCHDVKRERSIKREARRYLLSLIGSVAESPPPDWWEGAPADPRKRNCVQAFFFGSHRLVGLIKDTFLPPALTLLSTDIGARSYVSYVSYVSTTKGWHSHIWQPSECVWNGPFFLDAECFDTQTIANTGSAKAAALALVSQCLGIAARSIPAPKRRDWATSWTRVQALSFACLGSAHRSTSNANLSCLGAQNIIRANAIKREAQWYLVALMSSVELTPALNKWRANVMDLKTIALFDDFFMDGAKHREVGFIHPDLLPDDFPNITS